MKKFLCALLLAALLCGLFAQAAGAVEYEPGSTTERFEGARVVSEWREILAMGEELGAVLMMMDMDGVIEALPGLRYALL